MPHGSVGEPDQAISPERDREEIPVALETIPDSEAGVCPAAAAEPTTSATTTIARVGLLSAGSIIPLGPCTGNGRCRRRSGRLDPHAGGGGEGPGEPAKLGGMGLPSWRLLSQWLDGSA